MKRILVVDDEKIVRLALRSILQNYEDEFLLIGEARDGLEALAFLEKQQVDILITDLKMPGLDGIGLIKELAKLPKAFPGQILVLSNYDDYVLVREAMKAGANDYLLKLVIEDEEFMEVLRQLALKCQRTNEQDTYNSVDKKGQSDFLTNLILCQMTSREIEDRLLRLHLNISTKENIALLISIDDIRNDKVKVKLKNRGKIFKALMNIIEDTLQRGMKGEIINLEYRNFVLILPAEQLKHPHAHLSLTHLANKLIQNIWLYLNISVSIVISPMIANPANIAETMCQVRRALEYKFYTGFKSVICMEDLTLEPGEPDFHHYIKDIQRLKEWLALGQGDAILSQLEAYIEEAKAEQLYPGNLKMAIAMIMDSFTGVLIEIGEHDLYFMESIKKNLMNMEVLEDYRQYINEAMKQIHHRVHTILSRRYRLEVRVAMAYIQQNLHRKISIKELATQCNVTETYMSKLFKAETGSTIIQYINHQKLDKAKELLRRYRSKTVHEISSEVGIEDPFYFNRIFKKFMGMTPTQYRKELDINKEVGT